MPISELLTGITAALPGANPMGENINFDPEFEVLKTEIGKLGGTDYDLIEEKSVKLLREKSKDLRLFTFLSLSFLKKGNWEGFADVFDGLATLAEQNYDALLPDRERAKQLALKWLSEDRYNLLLAERKPSEADYDHLARLVSALGKLKPILDQKFPDGSPYPANLYKTAQGWERSCKPKPKPEPAPAAGATVPQAAGAGAVAAAAPEVMESPKQAQSVARRPAQFLIEKEPQKPMGYRLMRCIRWDVLEKAPPSEGGKTLLPPPAAQQRTYFQNLIGQKDWKTALEKAEAAFAGGSNHLWLDLQRIIATACRELGEGYAAVRSAVLTETALLMKRIPELSALAFSDGSPLCDDATRDWLSGEVRAAIAPGQEVQGSRSGSGDVIEEEQRQVNGLVAAGKMEEALDLVQGAMRSSAGERDNFRRTMMVGSLLLKAKQPDIAISVLESLDQKISAYNLEKWEPDLAVEAWTVLVQAYKVAKAQKPQNLQQSVQDRQNTILSRISQIDPRKAFSLNK